MQKCHYNFFVLSQKYLTLLNKARDTSLGMGWYGCSSWGVCDPTFSWDEKHDHLSYLHHFLMIFVACATSCFSQEVVSFTVVVSAAVVLIFCRRLYKTASLWTRTHLWAILWQHPYLKNHKIETRCRKKLLPVISAEPHQGETLLWWACALVQLWRNPNMKKSTF